MKIARIYSNLATTFVPIRFNGIDDDRLSVVFAKITRPKDSSRDSHNLGKTTLIHLIDFLLLKEVSEKNSFLLKHLDRFEQFVFYIEIQSHTGGYVTIRRGIRNRRRSRSSGIPSGTKILRRLARKTGTTLKFRLTRHDS